MLSVFISYITSWSLDVAWRLFVNRAKFNFKMKKKGARDALIHWLYEMIECGRLSSGANG